MWKLLKQLFEKFSINLGDKESEFMSAINEFEKVDKKNELPILDPPKNSDPAMQTMMQQNAVLTKKVEDLMTALSKEQSDRENAAKTAADMAKANQEKKVTELITKAFAEKKITEAEKETYKKLAESNYEATELVINNLATKKIFENQKDDQGNSEKILTSTEKVSPRKVLTEAIRENMEASKTV